MLPTRFKISRFVLKASIQLTAVPRMLVSLVLMASHVLRDRIPLTSVLRRENVLQALLALSTQVLVLLASTVLRALVLVSLVHLDTTAQLKLKCQPSVPSPLTVKQVVQLLFRVR